MTICSMNDDLDPHEMVKLNLASLNCFKHLYHLEINEVGKIEGRLNLEDLQIASFLPDAYLGSSVELNCPRLRALKAGAG